MNQTDWILIGVAAAAVVAILVLAILALRRRQAEEREDPVWGGSDQQEFPLRKGLELQSAAPQQSPEGPAPNAPPTAEELAQRHATFYDQAADPAAAPAAPRMAEPQPQPAEQPPAPAVQPAPAPAPVAQPAPAPAPSHAEPLSDSAEQGRSMSILQLFVARAIRYAASHKLELVLPGTVGLDGRHCRLTLLLVGPGGVLGVKSLSFAGQVQANVGEMSWNRQESGQAHAFQNPMLGCELDRRLLLEYLVGKGIQDVPVDCVTVFINPKVQVDAPDTARYYTPDSLFEALDQGDLLPNGSCDAAPLAALLKDGVVQPK